ncbi:MAG: CesT family type III secretion system chaperone [Planctomycetota bacterium]
MSRINHVESVFHQFGERMGMGPLVLDSTDRVSLVFDGVLVTFAYSNEPIELIWIYIDLGSVPEEGVAALQTLLTIGFDSWAHNIMTIGLDDEGQNAVGYTSIAVSMLELPLLEEMVSRMLQAASLIRSSVEEAAFEEAQAVVHTDGQAEANWAKA